MAADTKIPADNQKIDSLAVLGLLGVSDSLAYKVHEIEGHLHSANQLYGLTANTMARKSTVPIVITGGSDAWGTELELHNGTVIESGSATKKLDANKLYITSVGTANRVTILEFYNNTLAADSASVTLTDAGDLFTLIGNGLANGDKIMLKTIANTTGINIYTIYYVISVAGNNFQVSLTLGGAAVVITTNGTCVFNKITASLITELLVCRNATSCDGFPQIIQMSRQACNSRISCRAWATGGTNAISFFLGLHIYIA